MKAGFLERVCRLVSPIPTGRVVSRTQMRRRQTERSLSTEAE